MASTSHRRCQYRGEGCTGTAHAGHDQCAWCYFQYVKPALKAEREEMKRRRALKRMVQRGVPTPETQAHISAVDLKEPLPIVPPDKWLVPEQAEKVEVRPISVRRAISIVETDREIEQLLQAGKPVVEALGDILIRDELKYVPTTIYPIERKEPPPPTMPAGRTSPKRPPLSDEQKAEIVEAYRSGLPTPEIEAAYKIGSQTLYTLVRKAGVPLRGQPGQKYQPPRAASQPVPTPQGEAMPPTPSPTVSAPAVEPSSPNGVVSGLTEWTVMYEIVRTESKMVSAKDYAAAAQHVLDNNPASGRVEIISVSRFRP